MMRILRLPLFLGLVAAALVLTGCVTTEDPKPTPKLDVEILDVGMPVPVVDGTRLHVTVRGLESGGSGRQLEIAGTDGTMLLDEEVSDGTSDALVFVVTSDVMDTFGTGDVAVELTIIEGEARGEPYPSVLPLAESLPLSINETSISGTFFRNDTAVVTGVGFIAPEEGEAVAEFTGTFTPDAGGGPVGVSAVIPVAQVESTSRERGSVLLTTDLGGIFPGQFTGSCIIKTTLNNGQTSESGALSVDVRFTGPALFDYDPADPYLGQIVTIRGGGFLGAPGAAGEVTILEFTGDLELDDGSMVPFGPEELVAVYVSGQEVRIGIEAEKAEDELRSTFFGTRTGTFRGTVVPVVLKGQDELRGDPVPIQVTVRGVQQVVLVRFLPGFFDSLRLFGLSSAADEVVDTALERMRSIYSEYNVVFVTSLPENVLESAVTTLEIGGPDPNGLGLFGYDNTPGKDINNLRLSDSIGGANAETQADNFPGYGGVFIESFLFWSANPELPPPSGAAPEPEPLFDEVFGPVRDTAATLEEARNPSGDERSQQVQRAIRTLGSIVGETSSHELGHSFGLAQPYGSSDAFHSAFPGDGCLMDSGAFREFGERAAEPGYPETRFCNDVPEYLEEILPTP